MLQRLGHDPRMLVVANSASLAMSLARNVILARLIGPEQFGVAATLLLLILFFDAISDSGTDRYLIQSREGDNPEVQHTAQSVIFVRGTAQAALMIAGAIPLAQLFNTPGAEMAYMWLALVPFLTGLVHLDSKRRQRQSNFGPEILMVVAADLVSLVVTVTSAFLLRDFHAALYGLIARALTLVAVSHLVAERRFGVAWRPEVLKRLYSFGWPLMLSAITIFLTMQSDRLMVAQLAGIRDLGIYSAAVMLTYSPVNVLFTTFARVGLARLSRFQDNLEAFDRQFLRFSALVLATAILCGASLACFGRTASMLLFGKAYAESSLLFTILGFLQATRLLRVWPTCGSFALGMTRDLLAANSARLVAIPIGYIFFRVEGSLSALALGFFAGELLALIWALVRYNRLRHAPLHRNFKVLLIFLASAGTAFAIAPVLDGNIFTITGAFLVVILVSLGVTAVLKPNMLRIMAELIRVHGYLRVKPGA